MKLTPVKRGHVNLTYNAQIATVAGTLLASPHPGSRNILGIAGVSTCMAMNAGSGHIQAAINVTPMIDVLLVLF